MSTPEFVTRAHLYFRQHSRLLLQSLLVSVAASVLLLFVPTTWSWATWFGLISLPIASVLLFLNILGYDLMPAVTPVDVFEDLKADPELKKQLDEMETQRSNLVDQGNGRIALRRLVLTFFDDYRDTARLLFVVRMLRYLLVLFCMLSIFASLSRLLVLSGTHHYTNNSLEVSSSFVDHLYFAVVTLATIGYGDIAPNSWQGRIVCILEGLTVIFAVSVLLNYIMAHEAKREDRLREALTRYFDVII